jgi:hypothetical protein
VTQSSYPLSEQDLPEAQWRKLMAHLLPEGVRGTPGDTILGVYGDSTGLQVKLRAGEADVQGFHYVNDAELVVTIGANSAGAPRLDTVVLRYTPGAGVVAAVVQGATSTTPVAPALTRNPTGVWEVPIADVRVESAASTIAADKVTDRRPYLGRPVIPCLSTTRPLGVFGMVIAEADTGLVYIWDGSEWAPFSRNPQGYTAEYVASWPAGGTIDRLTIGVVDDPFPKLLVASWEGFTPDSGVPDLALISVQVLRNGLPVLGRTIRVRLRNVAVIQGGGSLAIVDDDPSSAIYKLRFIRTGPTGGIVTGEAVSLQVIPQAVLPA